MRYWLMKTEPSVVGIDHVLAMPGHAVAWWGVRAGVVEPGVPSAERLVGEGGRKRRSGGRVGEKAVTRNFRDARARGGGEADGSQCRPAVSSVLASARPGVGRPIERRPGVPPRARQGGKAIRRRRIRAEGRKEKKRKPLTR